MKDLLGNLGWYQKLNAEFLEDIEKLRDCKKVIVVTGEPGVFGLMARVRVLAF